MLVPIAVVLMLLAALLTFAATKPDTYRISRSTSITAPPARIFGFIDDFRRWGTWSPFEKMDPTMQRAYSGAASGKGAVYAWEGKGSAGIGRMEITEVAPPLRATIAVDFAKPFRAHNVNEFTLEARGDVTQVTWAMQGTAPFVLKVMSVFVSPDRLMGGHFETGLASLKAAAEG
jgi:hypothetical protein